jgi:hypothetical protein
MSIRGLLSYYFFFSAEKEGTGRGSFFFIFFFCDRCETRDPRLTVCKGEGRNAFKFCPQKFLLSAQL